MVNADRMEGIDTIADIVQSVVKETAIPIPAPSTGTIPKWLTGKILNV